MRIGPIPVIYPPSKPRRDKPKPPPKPKPKEKLNIFVAPTCLEQGQSLSGRRGTLTRSVVLLISFFLIACGRQEVPAPQERKDVVVKYPDTMACDSASIVWLEMDVIGFEFIQRNVDGVVKSACSVINSLNMKETQVSETGTCTVTYMWESFKFEISSTGWQVTGSTKKAVFNDDTCGVL